MDAGASATDDLRVVSGPVRSVLADILGRQPTVPTVPLAVLISPLAHKFAAELAVAFGGPGSFVLARIAARRNRAIADGDLFRLEACKQQHGSTYVAGLHLRAPSSEEAFHCEAEQVALSSGLSFRPTANRNLERVDLTATVTADHLIAYAAASGDFNPLHLDRDRCAVLGLPERVVHGTLLASLAEAVGCKGETGATTIRFASPCFVNEVLSLVRSDRPEGGRRVTVHGADGRLACAMDWRP